MKLFRSIYKTDDYTMRVERFIKRCNDPAKLARMIRESASELVREKAAEKLGDQSVIKELAEEYGKETGSRHEHFIAEKLTERVADEAWLKKTYQNTKIYRGVRLAALRQIKERSFLMDIVEKYDGDNDVFIALNGLKLGDLPEEQVLRWILRPTKEKYESWRRFLFAHYSFSLEAVDQIIASTSDASLKDSAGKKRLDLLLSEPVYGHETYLAAREAYKLHEMKSSVYADVMRRITEPEDLEQALTEYENPMGADGIERLSTETWAWERLSGLSEQERLLSVAKKAKAQVIRWKACKQAGGHFFPKEGNLCCCEVCGFEHHYAPDGVVSGQAYRCKHCGGLITPLPFSEGLPRSFITYSDGTKHHMQGYDGLQYGEEILAEKNDLF